MADMYDLIIIGSGPAGLAAAVYAQRARLHTLVIEKAMVSGGQVLTTYEVDNYPDYRVLGVMTWALSSESTQTDWEPSLRRMMSSGSKMREKAA